MQMDQFALLQRGPGLSLIKSFHLLQNEINISSTDMFLKFFSIKTIKFG